MIAPEVVRYAIIGVMNTALNIGVMNGLMFISGVARGPWIPAFSVIAFAVTIVHSFVWNKLWVFKDHASDTRRQFWVFATVTVATALLVTGLIHLLVNVVGAPPGVSPVAWVNIVLIGMIPVSFITNFVGIKLLVFQKKVFSEEKQ